MMQQRLKKNMTFRYQRLTFDSGFFYAATGRGICRFVYRRLSVLWLCYMGSVCFGLQAQEAELQYVSEHESGRLGEYDSTEVLKENLYLKSVVQWDKESIHVELSVPIKKLELQTRYYVSSVVDSNFSVWLYESMKNLQVNSQQTLEDFWGRGNFKNPYNFLKTILKREYSVFHSDLKSFRSTYEVLLVPDLMKIWVGDNFTAEEFAPSILNQNATEFTGLIIYSASELPIRGESYVLDAQRPALFPRIYDENLGLLMSYRNVAKDVLLNRGMLDYDVTENESKYQDLVGSFPMRILVRELFGTARTDMIISNADAKVLQENPFMRAALKEGRILVLVEDGIDRTLYSDELRSAF